MFLSHLRRYKLEYLFYVFVIGFTCVLTYPAWLHPSYISYGAHHIDHIGTLYGFWWHQYSFQNNLSYENLMLAQPFGWDEGFIMSLPVWSFLIKFFSFFGNHIATYNILLFLSFPLTFFTSFLFLNYCVKEKLSSYMGAFIFTFCPYHVSRSLIHFSLAHIEGLPLAFLSLFLLSDRPSFKRALLCAFSFLFVLFSDYYYGFFVGIFALLFFVLRLLSFRISWPELKAYGVSMAVFLLLFCLALQDAITTLLFKAPNSESLQAGLFKPDFQDLFRFSAKPLGYLLPVADNPFFGHISRFFSGSSFFGYSEVNYLEHTIFIGFTTILLSFLGLKLFKKENKYLFWISIILGFSFLIFSFSPYWEFEAFKIYFPSYFLYKLIPTFRSYGRMSVLFLLVLVIFSSFGFKRLIMNRSLAGKALLSILVIFFITIEFITVPPFHGLNFKQSPQVYTWVKEQKGDFIIAEYPLDTGQIDWWRTYFQSVHHKKLLNGCREADKSCKMISRLKDLESPDVPSYLKYLGIKYILYHSKKPLRAIKGLNLIRSFDNPSVWVYEIKAPSKEIRI